MSHGPTFDQRQIIFAHKSRIERAERERDEALALVKERTEERDRARRIAVELEQQLGKVHSDLWELYLREMNDPENGAIVACEALTRFDDITATVLNDMVTDLDQEGQTA